MEIQVIPLLEDNYSFLLIGGHGSVGMVDPADENGAIEAIEAAGGKLDFIFNTHHHWDHAGSNLALKERYDCTIIGPKADYKRIPGIDLLVDEGDRVQFDSSSAKVIYTPGHTRGHICFWFAEHLALFAGDTLFSLGCGRLFEGSGKQMWRSLQKLMPLPDATKIYCAHEYTAENGKFADSIDHGNQDLQNRLSEIEMLRKKGIPTIPATLGTEKLVNPFLRPFSPSIRESIGMKSASDDEVFTEIRRRKDSF